MQSDLLHTVKVSVSRGPYWPPLHCCSVRHLPESKSLKMILTVVSIIYPGSSSSFMSENLSFLQFVFFVAFYLTFTNSFMCCSVSLDHLVGDAQWELPTPPKPLSSLPQPPTCYMTPPQPHQTMRMKRDPRSQTLNMLYTLQIMFLYVRSLVIEFSILYSGLNTVAQNYLKQNLSK